MATWRSIAVCVALALGACSDDGDAPVAAADEPLSEEPSSPDSPGPQLGDHWHVAFGVTICGEEQPPLRDAKADESGIHSHDDGLIHVHPFTTDASGDGAVLDAFFETVGADVTDEGLVTEEWTLPFEGECDGEPAQMRLTTFGDAGPVFRTLTSPAQLRSIPLAPDGSAIALSLAPDDSPAPLPTSAAKLDDPGDVITTTTVEARGAGTPATDVTFGFAPVLGTHEAPCSATATPDATGELCYELSAVEIGPEAVEGAEATLQGGTSWVIGLVLTHEGIDAFNGLARACSSGTSACPTTQLAIISDGAVMSAPSVHASSFERDQISISGDFTEAEARELAARLDPGD